MLCWTPLSGSSPVQGSGEYWKEDVASRAAATSHTCVVRNTCIVYPFFAIMPWSSCWAATKEGNVVVVIVVSNGLTLGSGKFATPNVGGWGHQVPSWL